ncbi:MAG: nucleotidyltransferase domain-containing protein [Nitrospirae bacterium CG_4_10_14_0_8_um_filter_41_23]|nr:nucleotidyltransferase domain-containing protein [Nitrospirota bacterium]OIP59678.1 MAG: hypothetical protein AUK38_05080 [Nitrospirae bacterium CG2_30_41_42]PIQ94108.1 MAG: nucleotidyltransferase [Nitrospirae bacterium CG11_big_fil_rev_8_21_14_0_20_41_14]PIV44534.1 MAG: nucleotidyltransferase domain-containing protein [Nitrospirae bacterium CG02_land_8_20_14_3_00_41_53]PIW86799.1 MAG: nucleotidyltransferase domain-containing protein [Nitrospirae bacterium CG_4_8_14_3_um_filter_41_47]PIY866
MDKSLNNLQRIERESIREVLRQALEKHTDILFAYLHGSFVTGNSFRDIDVAVYLEVPPEFVLEYELQMEAELIGAIERYIIDVKVLNIAPLSFRYNVIKDGIILFAKNDDAMTDFQEATITPYMDFLPYYNMYIKETLGVEV